MTFNQIKLNTSVGAALIVVPLLGIPYSYKTFIIVALGAFLVYVAVMLRQQSKISKKVKKITQQRSYVFEESKPTKTQIHRAKTYRAPVEPEVESYFESEGISQPDQSYDEKSEINPEESYEDAK